MANNVNAKKYKKFKSMFVFLLNDRTIKSTIANHFDTNASLITMTLKLLSTRFDINLIIDNIKKHYDVWINLINVLYHDESIIEMYETILNNQLIEYYKINLLVKNFKRFTNLLIEAIYKTNLEIKYLNAKFINTLTSIFIYIIYSSIKINLSNDIEKILNDKQYNQKFLIISNTIKIFDDAKRLIVANFPLDSNNIIEMLIGCKNKIVLNK